MATRDFSKKQENTVAKYIDGKTTPNSGATGFSKGDILTQDTIVECKTKTKPTETHSIKKEWIETLKKECVSMGYLYWALVLDFGTQELKDQYALIPLKDFKEYLDLKKEYGTDNL